MYDFDKVIEHRDTADEKHDQIGAYFPQSDLLPMWVAEMDFPTAPEIQDALCERVKHGVFGYTYRTKQHQQALLEWYESRHHVCIQETSVSYDTGVLKSIFEMLRIFTKPQGRVLVPVPAYPQFFKVIEMAQRTCCAFPLQEEQHRYVFDFEKLREALTCCSAMIVCSPHNPGGRIWTEIELRSIYRLCQEQHVCLICDEIHSDLVMPGHHFTSMLEIGADCIVMNSVSKAFNLAGLQYSYSITGNTDKAAQIREHYKCYKIKSMNTLSMLAQETAYTQGKPWLEACCAYIQENDRYIRQFLHEHNMVIPVFELEAGYLQWLDFSAYFQTADQLQHFLIYTCQIASSHGSDFDERCGCYTRLNIAVPRIQCEEAMRRIYLGLKERGCLL